jgi:hypothetical protein
VKVRHEEKRYTLNVQSTECVFFYQMTNHNLLVSLYDGMVREETLTPSKCKVQLSSIFRAFTCSPVRLSNRSIQHDAYLRTTALW